MPEPNRQEGTALIACGSLEEEVRRAATEMVPEQLFFLEDTLHAAPRRLAAKLQHVVDGVSGSVARIILAFGLCSNGVLGVSAREATIIMPRCHDCLTFHFGSAELYLQHFHARPDTYYLTPGWIRRQKDPLHIMRNDYQQRLGAAKGERAMRDELKHYRRLCFFRQKTDDMKELSEVVKANADFFDLRCHELESQAVLFLRRLINGPHDPQDFIVLRPGERLRQEHFF